MTYPWDNFAASLHLSNGPQEVVLGGTAYTCYAVGPDHHFFATRETDLTVYDVDLDGQIARPVSLSAVRQPLAMAPQEVTASDMCTRAAQVPDLTPDIARLAIATHFATGLVTAILAEELLALVLRHEPGHHALAEQLAKYQSDMPGSPRRLRACTDAVLLLAPRMKP